MSELLLTGLILGRLTLTCPITKYDYFNNVHVAYGFPQDIPVPADYDGDCKMDLAVYRKLEGNWYIWLTSQAGIKIVKHGGEPNDQPVPIQIDGKGGVDLLIIRQGAYQTEWLTKIFIAKESINND